MNSADNESRTKERPLANRVALVTGGAQGIGRAICEALARDGATVVVADLNMSAASETTAAIVDQGWQAVAASVDVASERSVKSLYSQVIDIENRVDIVVNNAGICRMIPILDIEVEEWDRILAVNLRGTFLVSREAFRLMKDQGSGRIVSIASAAAKIGGLAAGAHYSASKAGVICFTKSLALQAAPYHINVNAVCPGPMATEMTDAWGDETNAAFKAKIPWQDYGRPGDVADAVAFLASDKARYITGEVLDVNGGLVMD
ncbi:MAG: SDR family oxidoreductase [Kiritimatiellae bacterium]|nr:SDR family oxidoreductase [Kiritimatiellia bacterium]